MKVLIGIMLLTVLLTACGPSAYQTKETCEADEEKNCTFNNCDSKSDNKQSSETFCNENLTKSWYAV